MLSKHGKIVQSLKYFGVLAFVNFVIPCVIVLWGSGNEDVFELNVIYLNSCVIPGLSTVSCESRVKVYRVCFAGWSWRSFKTGAVSFPVS